MTLSQALALANRKDMNTCAKLVRLNWITNDLKINPIRKPIVVNNTWHTIVGDTRVMAMDVLGITSAPVLAQLDSPQGTVITHLDQLWPALGFDTTAILRVDPAWADPLCESVDYFDIQHQSTSHHMHDEQQRHRMIRNYLNKQPSDFEFTADWCAESIDWKLWDY